MPAHEPHCPVPRAAMRGEGAVCQCAPAGVYVFLVYTIDHELLGAFGAREDADAAAKEHLKSGDASKSINGTQLDGGECKKNFDEMNFWSWYNENGEVTVEMAKLQ